MRTLAFTYLLLLSSLALAGFEDESPSWRCNTEYQPPTKAQATADLQYWEGLMYLSGRQGYPQNDQAAFANILAAADLGHVEAQFRIGLLYQARRGTPTSDRESNDQQARFWFESAALQGHLEAHQALGFQYEMGWGGESDYDEAIYHYIAAKEKGRTNLTNLLNKMKNKMQNREILRALRRCLLRDLTHNQITEALRESGHASIFQELGEPDHSESHRERRGSLHTSLSLPALSSVARRLSAAVRIVRSTPNTPNHKNP